VAEFSLCAALSSVRHPGRAARRRTPQRLTQLQRWALQTAERIGHNKAAVALTNKMVRICWAVWCHEQRFSGDWQSARPA
jgi:transposase